MMEEVKVVFECIHDEWKIPNARENSCRGLSRGPKWFARSCFGGTQLVTSSPCLVHRLKSTFPPPCKYYFEVKMKFLPGLSLLHRDVSTRERERLNDTLVTTRGRRVYLAYSTSTRELIKNLSLVEGHRWFRETFISQTVLVSEQISWTSCRLSRIFNFVPPTCSVPRKNRKFLHNIFPLFVKSIAFPISLTIQFMLPKNII